MFVKPARWPEGLYYRHHLLLLFHTIFTDLFLAWGSQSHHEAKPAGFFFSDTFHLIKMNLMWRWSNLSWTSWDYFWVRFILTRGIIAVLLTASKKNFKVGMHLDICKSIWFWFKLGIMIDTIVLFDFDTSLFDLDLDSRSQECVKQKLLCQLSHWILIEFGILLRLAGVMNLILIVFWPFNIQVREPTYVTLLDIIVCQGTFKLICLKFGVMLNTTKLYSLIPVWMTLMFTQGHRVMES